MSSAEWRLEMGARALEDGRVRFRVHAPAARTVEVELYPLGGGIVRREMSRDSDGVWEATLDLQPGALYRYRLDETWGYPDPYSRSQPEGVHGPSQVTDPAFAWTDAGWPGLDRDGLVIYELHVGAYTPEGTFDAIIPKLDVLRDLGVTALELMPVGEFPGQRNWGYDGAHRFAPESSYGGPVGLRRLVDAAHAHGLGVLLDVVYNHLGPDGDYLQTFAPDVLTDRYETPWGRAINYEGCPFVRRYIIDNLLYWMHEFHIDGFRVDATHEMYDGSEPHILRELTRTIHERAPRNKRCVIIAEHERHDLALVRRPEDGGYGFDNIWVDDFHHAVHVRLTNEHDGYLHAYEGSQQEMVRLLRDGVLYGDSRAGAPLDRRALSYCLQNHDQIGNRIDGSRLAGLVGLELYKAAYALLLFVEATPLIFMGDEYAASTPFLYFADNKAELAARASAGRAEKFRTFWQAHAAADTRHQNAQDEATFAASKLDWSEADRPPHDGVRRLIVELLRLRREDPVFRTGARSRAEPFDENVLVIERGDKDRRLIAVNFGEAVTFTRDGAWRPILSTAEARLAGPGVNRDRLRIEGDAVVELPGRSTTLWRSESGR
jgi:maltooligosyltrehalose trehalohydrolase